MCIRDRGYTDRMSEQSQQDLQRAEEARSFLVPRVQKFMAVSYTHLDVYKRQAIPAKRSLPPSAHLTAGRSAFMIRARS